MGSTYSSNNRIQSKPSSRNGDSCGDLEVEHQNDNLSFDEKTFEELKKQLAGVTLENENLRERTEALKHEICDLKTPDDKSSVTYYDRTIKAQEQYIANLTHELTTLHSNITLMKSKQKKRVKELHVELMTVKQEASMNQRELQGQVDDLKKERSKLNEKLDKLMEQQSQQEESKVNEGAGGLNAVVLALSQQLSEQDDIITDLRTRLTQRDRNIDTKPCNDAICNKDNSSYDVVEILQGYDCGSEGKSLKYNHIHNGDHEVDGSITEYGNPGLEFKRKSRVNSVGKTRNYFHCQDENLNNNCTVGAVDCGKSSESINKHRLDDINIVDDDTVSASTVKLCKSSRVFKGRPAEKEREMKNKIKLTNGANIDQEWLTNRLSSTQPKTSNRVDKSSSSTMELKNGYNFKTLLQTDKKLSSVGKGNICDDSVVYSCDDNVVYSCDDNVVYSCEQSRNMFKKNVRNSKVTDRSNTQNITKLLRNSNAHERNDDSADNMWSVRRELPVVNTDSKSNVHVTCPDRLLQQDVVQTLSPSTRYMKIEVLSDISEGDETYEMNGHTASVN